MIGVYLSRIYIVLVTDCRGNAYSCTHLTGSSHHPRATQANMRTTKITAGHKSAVVVLGIQGAIGNVIHRGFKEYSLRQEIWLRPIHEILLVMDIHFPILHNHSIRKFPLLCHIVKSKYIIAFQTPRFTLSDQKGYPFKL